ncbi:MAG: recombination-associated protein RdgC [Thiotrichaceae bacterium]
MWFKNLYFFKFDSDFSLSAEELHEQLANKPFTPCSPTQRESLGWVAPLGKNADSFTHASNNYILLTLARQERLLPATVVREELAERMAEIEVKEDRKVRGKEKKDLLEAIEFELLPRAFTRTQKMDAWIDKKGQWMVVNTSAANRAEALADLLRKTLGALPVSLPDTETTPMTTMTKWLSDGVLPVPFVLGQECELVSQQDDKSKVIFRNHDLLADEVQSHLTAGKFVSKLAIEWDEKISFVLTEDLQIKKLKFLDVMDEVMEENDPQSHEEQLDIEFALMTGEVSNLWGQLLKVV